MGEKARAAEGGAALPWLSVLSVALAVRAIVVFGLLGKMPLVSDAWFYSDEATRLANQFPGERVFFWPPGMPLLLALVYSAFGTSLFVARAIVIAMSVACVGLVMLVATRVVRDTRAAAWTGWIAALYPPAILMSGQTFSQHPASIFLLLLAWALLQAIERDRLVYWAVAGVALGLGCITRPSMQALGPLLAVAAFAAATRMRDPARVRSFVRGGLVVAAVCAACLLPVMLRNARLGGGLTISTNNERNFFLGNNPYTPSYKTSHLADRNALELGPRAAAYVDTMTRHNDLASRRAMTDEAVRYIRQHPMTTAWRTLNRARAFWGFDYIMSRRIQVQFNLGMPAFLPILLAEAGGYLLVSGWALVGLICARHDLRRAATALLLLLVLGYMLPYAIAFSGGTYHFPVVWLIMPFAGVAMAHGFQRKDGMRTLFGRDRRVWFALVLFLGLQLEYAYHTLALRP